MFFASIVLLPVALGILAGAVFTSRRPTEVLAGLCVLLGIAGAIATALDPDVTGRVGAVLFAVAAGVIGALLVVAGSKAGKKVRSALRSA